MTAEERIIDGICVRNTRFYIIISGVKVEQDGEGTYTCDLSDYMQEQARIKLNEEEETRAEAINRLRKSVKTNQNLECPTGDKFLLQYLRYAKFDHDKAYQNIIRYYTTKQENYDLFENFSPESLQDPYNDGLSFVVPHRDKYGRQVMVIRMSRYKPWAEYHGIYDIFLTAMINMELMLLDEETQINGASLIFDMAGFSLQQFNYLRQRETKLLISLLEGLVPLRIDNIVYWNVNPVFKVYWTLVSQFMDEDIQNKIRVLEDKDELRSMFGADVLPLEYGGRQDHSYQIAEDWKVRVGTAEHLFRMKMKHSIRIQDARITKRNNDSLVTSIVSSPRLIHCTQPKEGIQMDYITEATMDYKSYFGMTLTPPSSDNENFE